MTSQPMRTPDSDPRAPTYYHLEPMLADGHRVWVALVVRTADDGAWRGRLRFTETDELGDLREERLTAEIFHGVTEDDLWASVRALGEHHVRDLYRSLGVTP